MKCLQQRGYSNLHNYIVEHPIPLSPVRIFSTLSLHVPVTLLLISLHYHQFSTDTDPSSRLTGTVLPLTDIVLSLEHLTPPFVATSQTSPSCHCHTRYTFCHYVRLLHPHHSYFTPSSLSSVVKVYIKSASTQDVLVRVSMFTV